MRKKIIVGLTGVAGLGITSLALLAQKLGIARSNHWGVGRQGLLGIGLVLILAFFGIITSKYWIEGLKRIREFLGTFVRLAIVQKLLTGWSEVASAIGTTWNRFPPVQWSNEHLKPPVIAAVRKIRNTGPVRYFSVSSGRASAVAGICLGVLVVTVYVWFVSVGRWTDWPKNTGYYDLLAKAFRHGQASLLEKPDPALAGLADPYEFNNRDGIRILWDASYYNGKYFFYWGPAPALALTVFHFFTAQPVGDEVLVFAFVTGAFVFSALLILRLRQRLFPMLGWKYVIPAIAMAGFANPLPWLLNRPAIYEAAIAAGQFFLMAGLYFCFSAFAGQKPVVWKLALASACWVLAMASRLTLLPAALFLAALAGLYGFLHPGTWRGRWLELLALGLPMAAGLAGLLWYNKIRFDSWFEFGMRYALTGLNFHKYYSATFSLANFLPNFNNYLFNPFRTLPIFPYVKPDWGGRFLLFYFKSPPLYFTEQVSGLLPTLPFLFLALIALVHIFRAGGSMLARRADEPAPIQRQGDAGLKVWTFTMLAGAGLLALAPLLLFIAANMRYLADAVPSLVLLSILGFWQGAEFLTARPALRRLFIFLVILLVAYSAITSLLLAVTGSEARFENLNPTLFEQLTHWFSP